MSGKYLQKIKNINLEKFGEIKIYVLSIFWARDFHQNLCQVTGRGERTFRVRRSAAMFWLDSESQELFEFF